MKNVYTVLRKVAPVLVLVFALGFQTNLQAQLMKTSDEGQALMAIYNATDGANWTIKTNWGSDTEPLENWHGVTVTDGKVTRLRLVTNNLTGTLPDVFADLKDLTFLHLKENNLTGALPASLGDLVNLTFLGLNDNDFSGTLPAGLSNLTKLTELYIQKNGFNGEVPDLSGITDLKYFYLFENEFTAVHAGLQSLTILRELLLQDNFFTFGDLIPLKGLASNRFVYAPQGVVGSPSSVSKLVGEAFSTSWTDVQANDSYQWYKDAASISGANAATFSIASVALADAGVYHVMVTNSDLPLLTLTSAAVTLTVTAGPSDFPDWYLTTEADGDLAVVIDDPAVVTPAITKAYVWAEKFTGSAFEYVKYSPAILFNATGPYTWTAQAIAPHGTLSGNDQTRRVKIQLENASLQTSDLSDMQQSIHLTVNEGNNSQINLIWTLYQGRTVSYYEVWAADFAADLDSKTNTATLLATLPNTETTYTDYTGYDFYAIVAVFESPVPGFKNGGIKASQSNIYSVREDGFANLFQPRMKVYPNPVQDMATIEFDNAGNKEYAFYVLDLTGRIVYQEEQITGTSFLFNRAEMKTGVYLLQLVGERTIHGKMVIE